MPYGEIEEDPEDTTKMVKCEICGRMRPKNNPCCGVTSKNKVVFFNQRNP